MSLAEGMITVETGTFVMSAGEKLESELGPVESIVWCNMTSSVPQDFVLWHEDFTRFINNFYVVFMSHETWNWNKGK